jgi:tetratricopeptide (TPR) repeat protein
MDCLFNLAGSHVLLRQYHEAVRTLDPFLSMVLDQEAAMAKYGTKRPVLDLNPMVLGLAFALTGHVMTLLGRPADGYEYMLLAFERLQLTNHQNERALLAPIHLDLGASLNLLGRFEESSYHSKLAVVGFREVENDFGEAKALDNHGFAEAQLGHTAVALESFEGALHILATLQIYPSFEASANERLGTLFYTMGEHDEAFYHFQQSLKCATIAGIEMPHPGPAEKCAYISRMQDGRHVSSAPSGSGDGYSAAVDRNEPVTNNRNSLVKLHRAVRKMPRKQTAKEKSSNVCVVC